jgi:hypothetical protein
LVLPPDASVGPSKPSARPKSRPVRDGSKSVDSGIAWDMMGVNGIRL